MHVFELLLNKYKQNQKQQQQQQQQQQQKKKCKFSTKACVKSHSLHHVLLLSHEQMHFCCFHCLSLPLSLYVSSAFLLIL